MKRRHYILWRHLLLLFFIIQFFTKITRCHGILLRFTSNCGCLFTGLGGLMPGPSGMHNSADNFGM